MEFNDQSPIYIQIADLLCEGILVGEYEPGAKIPSIREMAVLTETNPNTVTRSYSLLQSKGIIYNKRGRGYFVEQNASALVREEKRRDFIEQQLPQFFHLMDLLDLSFEELRGLYDAHRASLEANEKKARSK